MTRAVSTVTSVEMPWWRRRISSPIDRECRQARFRDGADCPHADGMPQKAPHVRLAVKMWRIAHRSTSWPMKKHDVFSVVVIQTGP
jgi:hypothetical protein